VKFDRIHVPTGTLEDGFYAVEDGAAPNGIWVFRVKTKPAERFSPARQVLALAKNPYARSFMFCGSLRSGQDQIVVNLNFTDPDRQDSYESAMRRLVTIDGREDMGRMYARVFGRCRCCNRKLTHPDSVATGIGPECAGTRKHEEN
jgi:hypothetical protein